MQPLIQPSEAHVLIEAHLHALPVIDCPLEKCAGRILHQSITADRPFPPFNRAMMDGYALRISDIKQVNTFKVIAQAAAGTPEQTLNTTVGSCIEIMTGAVVPKNCDCIVPYEETQKLTDESIRLVTPETHAHGDSIHKLGSDHATGAELIRPGQIIGSREIAVAASCGYTTLKVTKLPSIAIVSTGDELVSVSQVPAPHQIRRSNDIMLETGLTRAGFSARESVHLIDTLDAATARLKTLIQQNDIIILSGGISMGKKDFIPEALDANGLECRFHGVAQKPGKPFGFWSSDGCAVFALPGNPLSTLTCLHHYVIPALIKASAQQVPEKRPTVRLTAPAQGKSHLTVCLPVILSKGNQATPHPPQNSGDLVSILASDGSIVLPPSSEPYSIGTEFAFHPWF